MHSPPKSADCDPHLSTRLRRPNQHNRGYPPSGCGLPTISCLARPVGDAENIRVVSKHDSCGAQGLRMRQFANGASFPKLRSYFVDPERPIKAENFHGILERMVETYAATRTPRTWPRACACARAGIRRASPSRSRSSRWPPCPLRLRRADRGVPASPHATSRIPKRSGPSSMDMRR
jgi:hypothetical protein